MTVHVQTNVDWSMWLIGPAIIRLKTHQTFVTAISIGPWTGAIFWRWTR